ncbi:aspartyl-phosphate phosphatase Spo0E family protein [Paenibacillus sp. Soil522]|uniref:aspartyl-phosphate phosphatase Spo0E family protein n=1 Tax=Paenibacillus sp. Soil522 TaxID=1736388 RepID=UPI0009D70A5F|nr:aspartyl-phosphate phosphatase Spo0E family protein [Paenibacillus sp. Soil522]
MDELLKRIEEARHNMHELAERYGLTAPQVVEQSQKLDKLLNTYYQMKARKSA